MKEQVVWTLMHIVGPLTLLVLVVGVLTKVSKAAFGETHENAVQRFSSVVGGAASRVWHYFFLNKEERERLDHFERTGEEPNCEEDNLENTEVTTDVPDSVLGIYEKVFTPSKS